MRNEIPLSQDWRTVRTRSMHQDGWWSKGRRTEAPQAKRGATRLEPEVVDAVLEQEAVTVAAAEMGTVRETTKVPTSTDFVKSLSTQLAMLEAQRQQLQQMLNEANGVSRAADEIFP